MQRVTRWLSLSLMACTLLACNPEKHPYLDQTRPELIDPYRNLTRDDYKQLSEPVGGQVPPVVNREPEVPRVTDILAAPQPAQDEMRQRVSISVTEDVPLKDVFIELARLANVGLELDPEIKGGIVFRAKDRPLEEVVRRVTEMSGLRYEFRDGALKVERDTPIYRNYEVSFLNVKRSGTGSIDLSTNVLSSAGGGGGGGGGGAGGGVQTGSKANVTIESESDLWDKLEESITKILDVDDRRETASNSGDEAQAADAGAEAGDEEAEEAEAEAPAPPQAGNAPSGGSSKRAGGQPYYVLNKEGGVLSVYATKSQHDRLSQFLDALKKKTSTQVLIEAKILEVTLNEAFRSGIEWGSFLFKQGQSFKFNIDGNNIANIPIPGSADGFTGAGLLLRTRGEDGGFQDLIQFTEGFGTTRTLSSPRVHAMNNQPAVFTFARNEVYFELDVQREQNANALGGTPNSLLTVDSQVRTVPIGVMISVMPSIDMETDEITLHIRPTLSSLEGVVSDPAVAFLASQSARALPDGFVLENNIPIVQVRELDTTMKMRSGDVLVIGGLMENRSANQDTGVPGAQTIPLIGNLFKRVDRRQETVETVIFLRATLANGSESISAKDKQIYKTYSQDPRPLPF